MARTRGDISSSKRRTTSLRAQWNKKSTKKSEASEQEPEQVDEIEAPKEKTLKKVMTPAEKYAHFL